MSVNAFVLYLYCTNSWSEYTVLLGNIPSGYVSTAQVSSGIEVSCHCDSWPVQPCYFSMEQNLSWPLGIRKFHNEVPWHGFVQSFYCVFPESIKFWNMSISSKKFFKWFLWKFLHVFSFWNSYPLAFGPPDRLFNCLHCSLLFHFFLTLPYFLEDFFQLRFIASYWISLLMFTIIKL